MAVQQAQLSSRVRFALTRLLHSILQRELQLRECREGIPAYEWLGDVSVMWQLHFLTWCRYADDQLHVVFNQLQPAINQLESARRAARGPWQIKNP